MILTNKLLPVALIAALVGGSVGALVMHKSQPALADDHNRSTVSTDSTRNSLSRFLTMKQFRLSLIQQPSRQLIRRVFADGYAAAMQTEQRTVTSTRRPARVVYRNSGSRASSNRVYYNYEPRRRSFWDKHRDKLTVAMGTGGGAPYRWSDRRQEGRGYWCAVGRRRFSLVDVQAAQPKPELLI
jgi:hypothetical protein